MAPSSVSQVFGVRFPRGPKRSGTCIRFMDRMRAALPRTEIGDGSSYGYIKPKPQTLPNTADQEQLSENLLGHSLRHRVLLCQVSKFHVHGGTAQRAQLASRNFDDGSSRRAQAGQKPKTLISVDATWPC